jgi:hypothetical protein
MNKFGTNCSNAFGLIFFVQNSIITNRLNLLITSVVRRTCFGNILQSSGVYVRILKLKLLMV